MNKNNFKIYHFIRNWVLDIRHLYKATLIVVIFSFLFYPFSSQASNVPVNKYPRVANYFLKWQISDSEATQLARWDLLVLDMETGVNSAAQINKIRTLNPKIIILAYITPQEIVNGSVINYSSLRRKLASQLSDSWYLRDISGNKMSAWGGTYMLNLTTNSPVVNGLQLPDFMAKFVADNVLSTGLWDGVFYDNAWENLTGIIGFSIDTDNNGKPDSNPDIAWQNGLKKLYNQTRNLTAGKNYLIVGNATTDIYRDALNGNMSESFPHGDWTGRMNIYKNNNNGGAEPRVNIINANTNNSGSIDYQDLRLALGSTLLFNGYFSYDHGNSDHGQTWWYDEYNVNLGEPIGTAVSTNNYSSFKTGVWKRDFANGLVLVNSSDQAQTISLGGEYEKIHGTQDPKTNSGEIITETTVPADDGLLLLKTFATLPDVLFVSGDFLRFFDIQGNRVRNGFFVFENGYKGGDKIAHIDLDGNGQKDLLVVSGNKITAWRDDGQLYMKIYPYTVDYKGELRVALGDLNKDGFMEVYVAPSPGYPLPIKIYTRHGRQMKNDWYPFGEKYFGGYSIAVGDLNNGQNSGKDLIVAKASGEPKVNIFDYNYKLAYSWLAFNRGVGVNVAGGNVDGNPGDEVVVGAGAGAPPLIRIFNEEGKLLNEFTAYSSLSNPGIEVLTADVNADGQAEIVGMSNGF